MNESNRNLTAEIVAAFGNQIGRHEGSFTLRYIGSKRWNSNEKKIEYEAHPLDEFLERGQRVIADRIDIGRSHTKIRLTHKSWLSQCDEATSAIESKGSGPWNSVLFEWVSNNNLSFI